MSILLNLFPVLAIDCQATGANPDRGHLLEVGWARTRPDCESLTESGTRTRLIRLPDSAPIPSPVTRITGIVPEDLQRADAPATVWRDLAAAGRETARLQKRRRCVAVIHFARFERPFLRRLHGDVFPDTRFPFQLVCTHEIARRLYPELPRRGLRALAGYFGHALPSLRRSGDHVLATAHVWKQLVRELARRRKIRTLEDLSAWLALPLPRTVPERRYPMDPKIRRDLPDTPGIYRMRRTDGGFLYIGKASSLKDRVQSYFRPAARHPEHILEMLTQAKRLDTVGTRTVLEAALLENIEIKKERPPYNLALNQNGKALWFSCRDFSDCRNAPDRRICIGPLPNEKIPLALSAMIRVCREIADGLGPDPTLLQIALMTRPEHGPAPQVLLDGFALFRRQHPELGAHGPDCRIFLKIGTAVWRKRLGAVDMPIEDDGSEGQAQEGENGAADRNWVPEDVAVTCESVLCHAAHMIRRARWFSLLSESVLTWRPQRPNGGNLNLIVIERGRLKTAAVLSPGAALPTPDGYRRSIQMRKADFDLAVYDGLRVLTTEMRRLVAAGRFPALRLSPSAILGPDRIARALRWV